MRLDTVIQGGTIVTADDTYRADVGIVDGRIGVLGLGLEAPEVIDASGKYVMPGGLDVHTHLDMPFGGTTTADDWESGTIAAEISPTRAEHVMASLAGRVDLILDMVKSEVVNVDAMTYAATEGSTAT